jgi:hypothetical protein
MSEGCEGKKNVNGGPQRTGEGEGQISSCIRLRLVLDMSQT